MNIKALTYRLLGYKTVDELFDEVKKGKTVSGKAMENARKLSKTLMPTGLLYPKGGEVFEAVQDVQISYLTHFMAPYTGGDKAKLLKGERVIVSKPSQDKPLGYYCYPMNTDEVEERIIPNSDKSDPAYNGFSLSIDTKLLNSNFKQIELTPIKFIKGDATNPTDNGKKSLFISAMTLAVGVKVL